MAAVPEELPPNVPRHGIEGLPDAQQAEPEIRPDEEITLAGRIGAIIDGIVVVNVRPLHSALVHQMAKL